ncbi:MAG: family 16 glycoside hydrolase [Planctomycetota bacterium]|jgi:sugar phosphate isomerase/epimerase
MKNYRIIVILVGLSLVCSTSAKDCSECHKLQLTGEDFSAWDGDKGQWQIVEDANLEPDNAKLLAGTPGTGAMLNGRTGRTKHLLSKEQFGDVRAHLEFKVAKDSNSGVYFMGRYEIQVFDSWQKQSPYPGIECGGIYQRWDNNREPKGFEGHSPRINASRAPGQWQTFDVVFRAPRFDSEGRKVSNARFENVIHNGVLVHEAVEVTGPTRAGAFGDEQPFGPLMLQGDHGPVAYRNVWLAPAGANPFFAFDNAVIDDKHQTALAQVETLHELGYAGISVGLDRCPSLSELLAELDKRNLRLFSVYAGVNVDRGQEPYSPALKAAIKTLEGRNTILWLFMRSNEHKPSSPAGDKRAVKILTELAALAAQHKVRIALYPHHAFWLERVEDAVRIADKVDRSNVGVTFNLCHWLKVNPEKSAESLIKLAMPRLFIVSINGADTGGQDWKTLIQTLDRGTFDMAGFLKTLADAGYTGPIGLQAYGIGGDAHDNLKRSMEAWERFSRVFYRDMQPFEKDMPSP